MGSMFGGTKNQTSTNKSTTESNPWAAQQPYLMNMFNQAQGIFNQNAAMGTPYDQGFNRFADPTQSQRDAIRYMQDAGNQIYGMGQQGFNMGGQLGTFAQNQGGANMGAIQGSRDYWQNRDAPEENVEAAGRYADNPYLNAQIEAAQGDVSKMAQGQVSGLNARAARSGNMNNSRAGVAEGVINSNANDTVGQISSGMRGNAWSQGLQQAGNDAQLRGAMDQSTLGLMNNLYGMQGSMMGQAGQLQLGEAGMQAGLLTDGANMMRGAGDYEQGLNQIANDNAFFRDDYLRNLPWQNMNNYGNIVGGMNWGGTTNSTGTSTTPVQTPGWGSQALKIAGNVGLGMLTGGGSLVGGAMLGGLFWACWHQSTTWCPQGTIIGEHYESD
ncbi:MAG: hypothetical protein HC888_00880 [Candidatus Competibacteraceae bacterium]|nr:hypothetical protein [Candidatus Competibacteraceae bacterium]